jgi:hypothetical protein
VDERAVHRKRLAGQPIHDLAEPCFLARREIRAPVREGVHQRAGDGHLQRAFGDRQQAELLGDDLPLLGDLDAAADGAGRKRGQRPPHRRPAAATDGAATSVKERELDA